MGGGGQWEEVLGIAEVFFYLAMMEGAVVCGRGNFEVGRKSRATWCLVSVDPGRQKEVMVPMVEDMEVDGRKIGQKGVKLRV